MLRHAEYDHFVQVSKGAICCLLWSLESAAAALTTQRPFLVDPVTGSGLASLHSALHCCCRGPQLAAGPNSSISCCTLAHLSCCC